MSLNYLEHVIGCSLGFGLRAFSGSLYFEKSIKLLLNNFLSSILYLVSLILIFSPRPLSVFRLQNCGKETNKKVKIYEMLIKITCYIQKKETDCASVALNC